MKSVSTVRQLQTIVRRIFVKLTLKRGHFVCKDYRGRVHMRRDSHALFKQVEPRPFARTSYSALKRSREAE